MKTQRATTRPVLRSRVLTVVSATGAAVVLWVAARVAGVHFEVATGGRPPMVVGLPLVAATAVAAALAGWGALALLQRHTSRPRQTWTAVALAVLLASVAPLLVADAATATRACLAMMHVAVGAVLIVGLGAGAVPVGSRTDPDGSAKTRGGAESRLSESNR